MILYQTERYDHQELSYDVDIVEDGDYVLWMKFAEVWFNGPNMKVKKNDFNSFFSLTIRFSGLSSSSQ